MRKLFISTMLTAVGLISASFSQAAIAESSGLFITNFAACKVKKSNANFFVTATEKDIKLKKGTVLSWKSFNIHQGLIVVEAKVGKKWIQGEILMDDTTCR